MIKRRPLLLGLSSLATVSAVTMTDAFKNSKDWRVVLADENRNFPVSGQASLRQRAAAKNLIYGAATQYSMLSQDLEFAKNFAQECALLVAEADLLWQVLRPTPDSFNFTPGDWLANFADTHNLLFGATHLVWHEAMPQWFKNTVNSQNAKQILLDHITTVVSHYAKKVNLWYVVNEAVLPEDGRNDGLRNTPWLQFLGPDYIEIAFRTAAAADPTAFLIYNDNGMDYDTNYNEAKRTAVLKLLERLKSRGVPVHGFGMQAHLSGDNSSFNPAKLKTFLSNIASLGVKILISEMDVTDQNLPTDVDLRDRLVAGIYQDYLSVVLEEPAVIGVNTWGLSDRYTWLSWFAPRPDGTPVRPLPLDTNLHHKLAWKAIAGAFDKAPRRFHRINFHQNLESKK